jgi:hypothetical protein
MPSPIDASVGPVIAFLYGPDGARVSRVDTASPERVVRR